MIKLGMNGKLYRNSGTWAAPAWVEVPGVKDVSIAIATGSGDASTRAMLPWKIDVVTLLEASVELDMPYDPTDAQYQAFRTAFLARTAIECAVIVGERQSDVRNKSENTTAQISRTIDNRVNTQNGHLRQIDNRSK